MQSNNACCIQHNHELKLRQAHQKLLRRGALDLRCLDQLDSSCWLLHKTPSAYAACSKPHLNLGAIGKITLDHLAQALTHAAGIPMVVLVLWRRDSSACTTHATKSYNM